MSLASTKRMVRAELRRRAGDVLLMRPLYDGLRYARNREARRLYEQARAAMQPQPAEQRVIDALRSDGIAIVHISDLLPSSSFDEISRWAEALASRPDVADRIRSIQDGAKPDAKGGKYYIVRPLSDAPAFDLRDSVIRAAVSDPVMRIVAGYLGLFARISGLDLWYNVATPGPATHSQRWHRDPEDRQLVKTFLYLRDCHEANGPFCFIPGTHNAGKASHQVGGYNYPDDGVVERQFPAAQQRICVGKAGTLIFCDTTGFHKGGHARAGSRFLFNAVYTSNACEHIVRAWAPHCTLAGSASELGPAARYAVGWLQADPNSRRVGGRFA